MSMWSMTAMSPGRARLTRPWVRRSTRAVPLTPGRPEPRVRRREVIFIGPMVPVQPRSASLAAASAPRARGVSASRSSARRQRRPVRRRARAPVSESSSPASIRDSSVRRPASSSAVTPLVVTRPVAALHHRVVLVGERGDLRQMGDDDDLDRSSQPSQPAADLDRGLAADARVDLVEDHRRHRLDVGQAHLDGQHHPRELATRRAPLQRPRLCARWAASSNAISSPPSWAGSASGLTATAKRGVRHRQPVQLGGHPLAPGRRPPRARSAVSAAIWSSRTLVSASTSARSASTRPSSSSRSASRAAASRARPARRRPSRRTSWSVPPSAARRS